MRINTGRKIDALDYMPTIPIENLEWASDEQYRQIDSPLQIWQEEDCSEALSDSEQLKFLLPHEREILRLRTLNYTQAQIAEKLNYTTQSAISHCLRRLKYKTKWAVAHKHVPAAAELLEALQGSTIKFHSDSPLYKFSNEEIARLVAAWMAGSTFLSLSKSFHVSWTQARSCVVNCTKHLRDRGSNLYQALQARWSTCARLPTSGIGRMTKTHKQNLVAAFKLRKS